MLRIQGIGYLIHALLVPPQLLKSHARVDVVDIRRTVRTRSRHHARVRGLLQKKPAINGHIFLFMVDLSAISDYLWLIYLLSLMVDLSALAVSTTTNDASSPPPKKIQPEMNVCILLSAKERHITCILSRLGKLCSSQLVDPGDMSLSQECKVSTHEQSCVCAINLRAEGDSCANQSESRGRLSCLEYV